MNKKQIINLIKKEIEYYEERINHWSKENNDHMIGYSISRKNSIKSLLDDINYWEREEKKGQEFLPSFLQKEDN